MFRGSADDDNVPMVVFHIVSRHGHCQLFEQGSDILHRVKNILAAQIGMPQRVDFVSTRRMHLRVLHGHRTAEHPAGARTHYPGDPVH